MKFRKIDELSTEDLIEELFERLDCVVFAYRTTMNDGEDDMGARAEGDFTICKGLCQDILDVIHDSSTYEEDDD